MLRTRVNKGILRVIGSARPLAGPVSKVLPVVVGLMALLPDCASA